MGRNNRNGGLPYCGGPRIHERIDFVMENPRFKKGDTARILHYISPMPRGTTVAIVEINETRTGFKYLVEGKVKGQNVKLWTKEQDLDLPFV